MLRGHSLLQPPEVREWNEEKVVRDAKQFRKLGISQEGLFIAVVSALILVKCEYF